MFSKETTSIQFLRLRQDGARFAAFAHIDGRWRPLFTVLTYREKLV